MPQNTGVIDEEGVPLNSRLLLKQKLRIKNCSPREICRDIVGKIYLFSSNNNNIGC